jgi:4-hydroxybenzoate polyprenyltransferase
MLLVAIIAFAEIHFIILLNNGVTNFSLGVQEAVGIFTVFSFLMWLRVADDLKDYETDKKLFKERPLPSGRTKKSDIIIACAIFNGIAIILNIIFMNNLLFCGILYAYGFLMANWFFQRSKIQPSLPLALITHNPVQMFVNLYTISFTVIKYGIQPISLINVMALFTLYFPALIWEISRKIRAPKDENAYTTYSKLFGYKKSTRFVMIMTLVDLCTNIILVFNLNKISLVVLVLLAAWMTWKFVQFMQKPTRFKLVEKVERYTYLQEATMLITVVVFLLVGKI